jgi:hypothetical protein
MRNHHKRWATALCRCAVPLLVRAWRGAVSANWQATALCVFALVSNGEAHIPSSDTPLQAGDELHLSMLNG